MKALVNTGVETLTYMDQADPIAKAGEELVRIQYSGICGSDMHAFLGHDARRPTPIILGHEASGTIVGGPRDGTLVTINPLNGCGTCHACRSGKPNICLGRQIISMPPRPGAFAELVAIPSENLLVVPRAELLQSAALTEPLACSWHAARLGLRLQDDPVETLSCVVLGGGAIGLGAALCLRAMGVEVSPIEAGQPVVVQGVQHIFSPPIELDQWPSADRDSRLVFITRNMESEAIRNLMSAVTSL